VECVVESLVIGETYIGAEGRLHRLGKVGLEQMDGRPTLHVAGLSLILASTTFKLRILPCELM
jgi:hypothetical protein